VAAPIVAPVVAVAPHVVEVAPGHGAGVPRHPFAIRNRGPAVHREAVLPWEDVVCACGQVAGHLRIIDDAEGHIYIHKEIFQYGLRIVFGLTGGLDIRSSEFTV